MLVTRRLGKKRIWYQSKYENKANKIPSSNTNREATRVENGMYIKVDRQTGKRLIIEMLRVAITLCVNHGYLKSSSLTSSLTTSFTPAAWSRTCPRSTITQETTWYLSHATGSGRQWGGQGGRDCAPQGVGRPGDGRGTSPPAPPHTQVKFLGKGVDVQRIV